MSADQPNRVEPGFGSELPLHFAAKNGKLDDVQKLLAAGYKVDSRDTWNITPLMLASEKGHTDIVRALVSAGANVNAKSKSSALEYGRFSSLHLAVANSQNEVVRLLLGFGADPNSLDNIQGTPLGASVANSNVEVVRMLFEAGANPNGSEKDKSGAPLSVAAFVGSLEIVKMLLVRGANSNHRDGKGCNALHGTFKTEIAVELIRAGADVNALGENGRTPIMSLGLAGSVELMKFYIESGADVNVKADGGITPLMKLASLPRLDFMAGLCDAGADVNAHDDCGNSVLDYFSRLYGSVRDKAHKEALEFLFKRGAIHGNNFAPKRKSRKVGSHT